jgi:hypothetical protein
MRPRTAPLLLLLVAPAGCRQPAEPRVAEPSVTITAGADLVDTISAEPAQPLVVQVLRDVGQPDEGVSVEFDAPAPSGMQVRSDTATRFSTRVVAVTGGDGRASVRLRMTTTAGPGWVGVSVPRYDFADTARYTVLGGHAVGLSISPRDTVVEVGSTFPYRGGAVDRAGNVARDPVAFEAGGSVTVTPAGVVSATAYGSGVVRVVTQVEDSVLADSATVTAWPPAVVAWDGNYDSVTIGSLFERHRVLPVAGTAPSWQPGGSVVVVSRPPDLLLVDTTGSTTTLSTPGLANPTWPEWSADGHWIYFQGTDEASTSLPRPVRIGRIHPDGTGMEILTPDGEGQFPSPSPDGRSVAYAAGLGVVVQDLSTGAVRTVASTNLIQGIRWSPDGRWIAFADVYLELIHPDGSGLHQVTPQHIGYAGISWSPDSRFIVGRGNVPYLFDITNGEKTGLPAAVFPFTYPAWRR